MPLTENVTFGNLLCRFEQFGTGIFHDMWKWKVDPYRTTNAGIQQPIPLLIENGSVPLQICGTIVHTEKSGFFTNQVVRTVCGDTIWSHIREEKKQTYLQYVVNAEWNHIQLVLDDTQSQGMAAFEYLGMIMPTVLLKHHMLSFHGVLLEYKGNGMIISAESGTGKTTRARMWRDRKQALIINGDCATVEQVDGIWYGYGLPWSGTSGEQINRRVPLKALVVLERGEENEVQRILGLESFGAVLPHVKYPKWDLELTDIMFEQLDTFLQEIPIVRVKCPPDESAAEVLDKVLEEC